MKYVFLSISILAVWIAIISIIIDSNQNDGFLPLPSLVLTGFGGAK